MNLLQYIKGSRKGKEAHRLEKEAMKDPFLADALDGYDKVKGDHVRSLASLQKQITAKSRKKSDALRNWSIAASILVLIGISGFLVLQKRPYFSTEESWAQLEEELFSKDKNYPSSLSDSSQGQEQAMLEPLADHVEKKESVKFTAPVIVSDEISAADIKISESEELADSKVSIPQEELALTDTRERDISGDYSENKKVASTQAFAANKADTSSVMSLAMKENKDLSEDVADQLAVSKKLKSEKFQDYVKRAMIRPEDGKCKNVKGKVEMTFYVDKQGRPYDIKIEKSLCSSADAEAIRLLETGPDWTLTDKQKKETVEF